MKIKKLRGDTVLIEPELKEEVTAGGITVVKDPDMGDYTLGTVRFVGTGKRIPGAGYEELDIAVGDKVLFQYGQKVKVEDKFLLLVIESDVKSIVE